MAVPVSWAISNLREGLQCASLYGWRLGFQPNRRTEHPDAAIDSETTLRRKLHMLCTKCAKCRIIKLNVTEEDE